MEAGLAATGLGVGRGAGWGAAESEAGWAAYLDQNAGSSYNMNQRPSLAEDGYFTPDIFSNPAEGKRSRIRPPACFPSGCGAARGD